MIKNFIFVKYSPQSTTLSISNAVPFLKVVSSKFAKCPSME